MTRGRAHVLQPDEELCVNGKLRDELLNVEIAPTPPPSHRRDTRSAETALPAEAGGEAESRKSLGIQHSLSPAWLGSHVARRPSGESRPERPPKEVCREGPFRDNLRRSEKAVSYGGREHRRAQAGQVTIKRWGRPLGAAGEFRRRRSLREMGPFLRIPERLR